MTEQTAQGSTEVDRCVAIVMRFVTAMQAEYNWRICTENGSTLSKVVIERYARELFDAEINAGGEIDE